MVSDVVESSSLSSPPPRRAGVATTRPSRLTNVTIAGPGKIDGTGLVRGGSQESALHRSG